MGFVIDQPYVWPFEPDWSNPVVEGLAWLTDVMQAADGAQQARALRDVPRRSFSFQPLITGDARRIMDGLRFTLGMQQILLPIFPDVQILGADLAATSTSIPCRTAGFDFAAGGKALLLGDDPDVWEVASIDTVEADHLTLSAGVTTAWPAGTVLYPLRKARLQGTQQAAWSNDELAALQAQFILDEPCDWPAAYPTSATYRSIPVLEWRNEESQDPTDQFDRLGGSVDYDTGPVYYFDMPGVPFRGQSQNFLLSGRDDHSNFRSLLYQLAGRASTLWVPSWTNDLRLDADVAGADTQIQMPWMGYTQFVFQQANRRDLRIELTDGTVLYRRIIGSADVTDHEVLQLDSALGMAVTPTQVRQINFMSLCALASDTVQITHDTDADGTAEASINWQAVKSDV